MLNLDSYIPMFTTISEHFTKSPVTTPSAQTARRRDPTYKNSELESTGAGYPHPFNLMSTRCHKFRLHCIDTGSCENV